jgi:hypothetical protein
MGEVDQAEDAVDQRVAQGDQGVNAAQAQAVDDVLNEGIQGVPLTDDGPL